MTAEWHLAVALLIEEVLDVADGIETEARVVTIALEECLVIAVPI